MSRWVLLFFLLPLSLTAADIPDTGPWITHVRFSNSLEFRAITANQDHVQVDAERGLITLFATPGELAAWQADGISFDIDWEATRALHAPPPPVRGQSAGIPGFPCYPTVDETFAQIDDFVLQYPDLASKVDIGDSWLKTENASMGDDLIVLRLTNSQIAGDKPALFVMTAMHAREYPTAPLTTEFARLLLEGHGEDADITWILDHHEIHLLLQANPDGRREAESSQPFWRKNHNTDDCLSTFWKGTDLNRNFPFQWNCCLFGSSGNPCEQTYRGHSAASEPETSAIMNYIRGIFPDQRGENINDAAPSDATGIFIDIHNFGAQVLWPYGFDCVDTPNGPGLQRLARKFAFFNQYSPEKASLNFNTNGTTDDFAYGDLGVAAFTIELGEISDFSPDCNFYENSILQGNLDMLFYAAKTCRAPYLLPSGPDITNIALSDSVVMQGEPVSLTASVDDDRYRYGIHVSNPGAPSGNCPPSAIATQAESVHPIDEVIYTINIPPWEAAPEQIFPMLAQDTLFDETMEDVISAIDTTQTPAGKNLVYLQAKDGDGNWGAVSALFLRVTTDVAEFYDRWPHELNVRDLLEMIQGE